MLTEAQESAALAAWLRREGHLFTSTANGAQMADRQRTQLQRQGLARGVPDFLVFTRPEGSAGIAIELKRAKGGALRPEQRRWLGWLAEKGWVTFVAHGADDAIRQIKAALEAGKE